MTPAHAPSVADWRPDDATVATANLTRLMREVGVADYRDLHRWSLEDVDGFWAAVVEALDVSFEVEPAAVRGSDDPEHPDWLPGARMNIVSSCLDGPDDAPAIVSGSSAGVTTMTVAELRSEVGRFQAGFRSAGYVPGDRIAIAMPMTSNAVVAYLGIVAAGGVVVSIADSFAPDEIGVRLAITEPVAIVTQDVVHRAGKELPMYGKCVEAGEVSCIVIDTGAGASLRPHDVAWHDFVPTDGTFAPVARDPGSHTNILFSSGTTGEPKAIPWTQTTPIKAAMDGRYHQDIHAGEVVAWPTNLGWMMGPWLIYASLLNDAAIALYEDVPTSRGFVEFIDEANVAVLGLVPSIVSAWRSTDALRQGDLRSVRVLSSTGEASNPDDYAWLMEAAGVVPVIEYCGGTEIGGGYITGTVVQPAFASRFTTPALGIDVVLVDGEGRPSDEGEVYLVGPSIGMSEELLNRDHHEVYFAGTPDLGPRLRRHGDQMARDDAGHYRALGRVDDTMNLGGIKVSSAEIEETVGVVEGVDEVAAIAVAPPGGGPDRLVIYIVASDGGLSMDRVREEMQDELRRHLNPLFRVHEVVAVDALPRTASQKVMRRVLRDGYEG